MGKGKDKTQRVRRQKTDAEKDATRRLKEAKRRKQEQKKHGSVARFFSAHEESKAENDAEEESTAAEDIIDDDTGLNQNPNEAEADVVETTDVDVDGIITFSEEIDAGSIDDAPLIVANLDIDEDLCVGLDEEAEAEPDDPAPTKLKPGVHLDYMRCINDRLKVELMNKTKGLEKT